MKRIVLVAMMLMLVWGCSKENSKDPKELYDAGMKALSKADFTKADSMFAKVQRADSGSVLAPAGQAILQEQQLCFLDAVSENLIVLQKDPKNAAAYGGATRSYYALETYPEALEAATKWTELQPDGYESWYWLALTNIKMRDFNRALSALDKAASGGLDKAAAGLIRAQVCWLRNAVDSAYGVASKSIADGSQSGEYYRALTDYYVTRGIADSAVAAARSGWEEEETMSALRTYVETCLQYKYFYVARKALNKAEEKKSTELPVGLLRQEYMWATLNSYRASIVSDKLLGLGPGRFTPLYCGAIARRMISNDAAASDNLELAIARAADPGRPAAFKEYLEFLAAREFSRSYNRIGAADKLQAMKGVWTTYAEYQALTYSQMVAARALTMADSLLDTLMPSHDRDPMWLTTFGDAFANAKGVYFTDGAKFYRMALDLDPQFEPAFRGLVKSAVAFKQYAEATAAFSQYPQYADRSPDLAFLKALSLVMTGKADEGEALLRSIYPRMSEDVWDIDEFARALVSQRKIEAAGSLISFALEHNKDNPDAYEVAARFALDQGRGAEGLDLARRGLKIEDDNLQLRAQEGRALYLAGSKDEAKKLLGDLVGKSRSGGEAGMYFSRILAEERSDDMRAQNMARIAIVSCRPFLKPMNNLAYVYLVTDRADLAIGAAQQAVSLLPSDPEAYYLLGVSQQKQNIPDAKQNLEKAIALGAAGDLLQKTQEALRQL